MTKATGSRTKASRLVRVRVITAAAEPPGRWAVRTVRAGAGACGVAAVVMGFLGSAAGAGAGLRRRGGGR